MRAIGLDYGEKTIGVAVSDALGYTAQAVTVIRRRADEKIDKSLEQLSEIIEAYAIGLIVLGFPKNMDNTLGKRADETLVFKAKLEKRFALPVELWDERLSSISAERVLLEADMSRKKRKTVIDKMAAVFILQNYLDYRGNKLD